MNHLVPVPHSLRLARATLITGQQVIGTVLVVLTAIIAVSSVSLSLHAKAPAGQELRIVLTSRATWDALGNSSLIALMAVVIACCATEVMRRAPSWTVPAFILFVAFDPVSRALAFKDVFMATFWPTSTFLTFLCPAVAAGMQYSIVPLLASLARTGAPPWTSHLGAPARWLFVEVPTIAKSFPQPAAIVFLLTLFDVGVVQAASGNRLLLWSPLLTERSVQSNSLSAGATMVLLGLGTVVICYGTFLLLSSGVLRLVRFIRPSNWPLRAFTRLSTAVALAVMVGLAMVPLAAIMTRVAIYGLEWRASGRALEVALRTVTVTWVVAGLAAAGSLWIVIGSLHSDVHIRRLYRASIVPALAPEQTFALMGVLLIATHLIVPGLASVVLMQVSFAVPVGVFLAISLFRAFTPPGTAAFGRAFARRYRVMVGWAMRVYRRETVIVLSICAWLVADDYLVAHLLNGPSAVLLTPDVFQSTRRDISPEDLALIVFGAAVRLVLVILPMLAMYSRQEGSVVTLLDG